MTFESAISIDFDHTIYHGIKKLWPSEIDFWLRASNREYQLYRVPNSKQNINEYWLVEAPGDLATLKYYLDKVNRKEDFIKKQCIQ